MLSTTTGSYVAKDLGYNLGMSFSSKIKVAVIRGGLSSQYDTSLKTGEYILSTLREMPETYEPIDILISKNGEWHREGLVEKPHQTLDLADVAWNALHGPFGEDGQIGRLFEGLQLPFTGSSPVASVLSMNKDMARRLYKRHLLLTPAHEVITKDNLNEDYLIAIFRNYLHPVIIKPANTSRSLGVALAYTFSELKEKIEETLDRSSRVLVEEFISGDEVSCLVIEGARDEKIYALIPVSKSKLKTEQSKEIERIAKLAHEALGLRHYSSSDFIITPNKKIYILESNSLPALHEGSSMHESLLSTGWRPRDFVNHVLRLAM